MTRGLALVAASALLFACSPGGPAASTPAPTPTHSTPSPKEGAFTGTVAGAKYLVEIPPKWNGALLLYSHGYVAPGSPEAASDSGDATTNAWLRAQGYALAGTSYGKTGWAIEDAFKAQLALLDEFALRFGKPRMTIAWGHSLGGIVTAGLVQVHPDRFDAALPMCGVLGGGIANWNGGLDEGFIAKTLLDRAGTIQLVHVVDAGGNLNTARQLLVAAQATAEGRARLALVAAAGNLPGWSNPTLPEPDPSDFTTILANQVEGLRTDFAYSFAFRAELESRAGGNPSWNTGVDYGSILSHSPYAAMVRALYAVAGLSLEADLAALAAAPRISADASAVDYLDRFITFNGHLAIPVLTLHTTGDGLVVVSNEAAYADVVTASGSTANLRQLFTHRAGHCVFTPAEQITAFQVLFARLRTGNWDAGLTPVALNRQATELGSQYNGGTIPGLGFVAATAAFASYQPAPFPRPFDSRSKRP